MPGRVFDPGLIPGKNGEMVPHADPSAQSTAAWLADYDRGEVERKKWEREVRREPWKWHHLVRRTILDHHADKHVLRCLADHAWAGPDYDNRGREDGVCVLLVRTIERETGLPKRTVERALLRLVRLEIIERESRGRRGGGRGASRYRILPSNPFEEKQNRHRGGNKTATVADDL